jgi:1,4-alpha-glucan branching enzyme
VFLVGTFNNWDSAATPMQRNSGDEWHAAISLSPGKYEYKFIVDGEWCCDPGIADEQYAGGDAVPNAFGTKNRVIEIE